MVIAPHALFILVGTPEFIGFPAVFVSPLGILFAHGVLWRLPLPTMREGVLCPLFIAQGDLCVVARLALLFGPRLM